MNKNFSKILIVLATSLWGGHLMAGSVTIPNTFVGGTTASASEVNANFDAVKTAVDENDSRITTNTGDISTNTANISTNTGDINTNTANISINTGDISTNSANITANTDAISAVVRAVQLKDANGVSLGRVIGMEKIALPSILTDQGYRTRIAINLGSVIHDVPVYYATGDCTGQAYVDGARYIGSVFTPGQQDLSYANGLILYVHNDVISSTPVDVLSTLDPLTLVCTAEVSSIEGYPALTNDPAVTGIQNTAYPVRMVLE